MKVSEPNVWKLRAQVVWEESNGPLPRGMVIHHENGDKLDDRLENLAACTKAEHLAHHRDDHANARSAGLRAAWARRKTA